MQCVDVGWRWEAQIDAVGLLVRDRLVLAEPVVDDVGQGIGLALLALTTIGLVSPADVVTNGALGNPESLGNLCVGLPALLEDLQSHDLLRLELPSHRRALPGLHYPDPEDHRHG